MTYKPPLYFIKDNSQVLAKLSITYHKRFKNLFSVAAFDIYWIKAVNMEGVKDNK